MNDKTNGSSHIGAIYISMDKSTYVPGETANWAVQLLIPQTLNGVSKLSLTLTGVEDTLFMAIRKKTGGEVTADIVIDIISGLAGSQTHNSAFDSTYTVCKGNKEFLKEQCVLFEFPDGVLPAGQYSFPVSFTFFEHMPSSIDYKFKSGLLVPSHAKITYNVEAELIFSLPSAEVPKPLSYAREVIVGQHRTSLMTGNKQAKQFKVSKVFSEGGAINMEVYFQKNYYSYGDLTPVTVMLDATKSNASVKEVKVSLLQKVELSAELDAKYSNTITWSSTILEGVKKGTQAKLDGNLLIQQPKDFEFVPTTVGNMIKNQFYIEVEAIVKTMHLGQEKVVLRQEITIRDPKEQVMNWAEQPANWDPQPMRKTEITLDKEKLAKLLTDYPEPKTPFDD